MGDPVKIAITFQVTNIIFRGAFVALPSRVIVKTYAFIRNLVIRSKYYLSPLSLCGPISQTFKRVI